MWFAVRPRGLESTETIVSYLFLINGQEVTVAGTEIDGLIYQEKALREDKVSCIRLSGGTVGESYMITLRYGTETIPSDDKSFYINVAET